MPLRRFRVAALALCAACATGTPQERAVDLRANPSGKPEVTVTGVGKKAVSEALAVEMVNRGFTVVRIDENTAEFERDAGTMANLLLGSQFNPQTKYRVRLTLLDSGSGTRVVGTVALLSNPGSGFEKGTDLTDGRPGRQLQLILYAVRDRLQ